MGSKFSHIFLREVSLGEKLYFGGKMICCNFFLTNKELMDRKTKRHKDKHRNNCESCQSQVTWKLEFKCQFPLSCLSIIICTICDFLFIWNVDLIHCNWPHSGRNNLVRVEVLSGNMAKTSTCRSFIRKLVKTSTCRSFIRNWVKTST